MKRVLIQCLHRPDRSPSQRFRFEQYIRYLESKGYQIDFSYLLNAEADKAYYQPGRYAKKLGIVLGATWKRFLELQRAKRYDLVFVQREGYMLGTAFFERAMAAKVPLVFDFDDSIWIQVVSEANKRLSFLKDASKTAKIIEKSALVFAGNDYLADYARQFNQNVVVIPTTIDTAVYRKKEVKKDEASVCIGWSGSFTTIEHFATALPALKQVREKYGSRVRFKIIGDKNYYCPELDVQGLPWVGATEVDDLSEFDIGIMPLPDTEWAKGKCGLKGLQYMALGIPTLMSPVGVNSDIIKNGVNGFLPLTHEEWVHYLSLLIEDADLRKRIGEAGQRTLEEGYSAKAWEARYLEHFDQLTTR